MKLGIDNDLLINSKLREEIMLQFGHINHSIQQVQTSVPLEVNKEREYFQPK